MKLFCYLRVHQAAPEPVWNGGYYFSRCLRCGRALVRRPQQRWRDVPPGFRVVWKARPPGYPDWGRIQPAKLEARPTADPGDEKLVLAEALLAQGQAAGDKRGGAEEV